MSYYYMKRSPNSRFNKKNSGGGGYGSSGCVVTALIVTIAVTLIACL